MYQPLWIWGHQLCIAESCLLFCIPYYVSLQIIPQKLLFILCKLCCNILCVVPFWLEGELFFVKLSYLTFVKLFYLVAVHIFFVLSDQANIRLCCWNICESVELVANLIITFQWILECGNNLFEDPLRCILWSPFIIDELFLAIKIKACVSSWINLFVLQCIVMGIQNVQILVTQTVDCLYYTLRKLC